MIKKDLIHHPRYHLLIISVAFIAINMVLYHHLGVKVMSDSTRYIDWAENLWSSGLSTYQWRFWYISYVLFLAILLPLGLKGVIFFQVAISSLACFAIYFLTVKLSSNKLTALLASLMYLFWIEIPGWNMFILTESLFTSMIVLTVFFAMKFNRINQLLCLLPLIAFTILIRPMGVTVLIALGFFFYYHFNCHLNLTRLKKVSFISTGLLFLLVFFYFLLEGNPDVHFYYARGQVVWGADQMDFLKDNPWLVVDNSQVIYPDRSLTSTEKFFEFTLTNFSFQLELFSKKLLFFIIHIKPYYSLSHNLFIGFTLFPVYGFCIYGLATDRTNPGMKYFTISLFLLNALMTGLTVESWDGRFLIPTLPCIFIYASIGFRKFVGRISNSESFT
ncbi:MAG: hypothetical protein RIM99_06710 [Cyclobacteriaceae bacterium]